MRVALIGANGQLGTDMVEALANDDVTALTHDQFDITASEDELTSKLSALRPDVIINTAAYHRVDEMEDFPEKAFLVNAAAVGRLAKAASKLNSVLVHISTDYVFSGPRTTPWTEEDKPQPQSTYATSKLAGEYLALANNPKSFVIRSCGLYGVAGCRASNGLNFPEMMLKLARERGVVRVVTDQILTPTPTHILAPKISQLMRTTEFGLYHITTQGQCSWFEFAQKVFEYSGVKVDLQPTTSAEFKSKAARPAYSVLDNTRLRAIGLDDLPTWQEGLKGYIARKHPQLSAPQKG